MMPQLIAENHSKFIDFFMKTGHYGLINKKRRILLKRSSGYVIQVNLFLSINHLDLKSMIMLIEPVTKEEI